MQAPTSYPTMIPSNNTSYLQEQERQLQQYKQSSTTSGSSSVYSGNSSNSSSNGSHNSGYEYQAALVPATGPGTTAYNNYDLLDLGFGSSTPVPAATSSPAAPATGDLLSFDDTPAFATPPPPAQQAQVEVHDTKALEARDEAFVKSLSPEIIEEQHRIMAQIAERNANNRAVASTETAMERYNASYDHAIEVSAPAGDQIGTNGATLPAEVHPAKYQMKETRKVKTAAGATTGAVIGGLMFGPAWPIGAAAGAAAGGYATKVAARSGERRKQRKWDAKNFNEYTARGVAGVQSESVAFA